MQDTHTYRQSAAELLDQAKKGLMENMAQRGIGAIIWDVASAGFHYIPEITHHSLEKDKTRVARITGLYVYEGTLYLIEEDRSGVSVDQFYDPNTEVKPTVVTLSEDKAQKELGNPLSTKGYTTQGSLEEWLAIADCYFEALAE